MNVLKLESQNGIKYFGFKVMGFKIVSTFFRCQDQKNFDFFRVEFLNLKKKKLN